MDKISLNHNIQSNLTIIPNEFIDQYMLKADGEYVKIYLLLLRLVNQNKYTGPEQLADLLELTQKDILRALNYWKKEGLLHFEDVSVQNEHPVSLTANQIPALRQPPKREDLPPMQLAASIKASDLERNRFHMESILGPLSSNDLNILHYLYQQLHFPQDLIEYLVEYCANKEKKSMRYIEKVALKWYEQGIDTVQKAKEHSAAYTLNVFPVMKAFGISNRHPAPSELDFIRRWNKMGFDSDILIEACNRTMLATHQASFPYANRILESWKKSGVHKLSDIYNLDQAHRNKQSTNDPALTQQRKKGSANPFHNFEQRSYDYDDLEARLLNMSSTSGK